MDVQHPQLKCAGRAKTPTILQIEAVECGAVVLGIILAYYGRAEPLAELRRVCGVSRDGSKASNILKAARHFGLIAQGFSMELEALKTLAGPFIVFWNFDHFVVVEGFHRGRFYINDPSTGPRAVRLEEFDRAFTGVVLTMEPGPNFRAGGQRRTLIQSLCERLRGSGKAITYCLGAGFLLVLPSLVVPVLTQIFVDHLLTAHMHDWLRPLLVGMGLTMVFRGVVQYLQLQGLRRLRLKLSTVMASQFLWHLLHLPLSFYAQRYAGEVSQRLALNDKLAEVLSGRLATTVIDMCMMCIYAMVMFQYDVTLTLIGLACAGVNLMILQWIARRRMDANMRVLQETGKCYGVGMAGLQQIDTLKASALEADFFSRWAGHYARVVNAQQTLDVTNQTLSVAPNFLTALAFTLLLILGGLRVMEGHLSIGMLIAFQSIMQSFLNPVAHLVNCGGLLQELRGELHRLDDALDNEPLADAHPMTPPMDFTSETFRLHGYVQARNLSYSHDGVNASVIHQVSFTLTPGKLVAVVGASGSGKSTLAKLVSGLYEPSSGELIFDAEPSSRIPRQVMTHSIAMVDQDIVFFAGTVRENLTLWDSTVSDRQLVRACKDAAIHEVVVAMPGGYDAILLENAVNLSGGERQRLEIARALILDPAVLILDEATSALDATTERRIVANLRRRGCACFIVAHRLSTIRDCDEIIVLDHGRVVQRGSHHTLRYQGGAYRRLLCETDHSLDSFARSVPA